MHVGVLCPDEHALHITATEGALALADGLHHYGDSLGFLRIDVANGTPAELFRLLSAASLAPAVAYQLRPAAGSR